MRFAAKSALFLLLLSLLALPAASAQQNQPKATRPRPVTRHEGLAITHVALNFRHPADSPSDCSHLVHALYERAGFPYQYAPSSDLYAGIDEFRRVAKPQPGDLAVWRGHAGIVVNPAQHSFFSMLSSGPGVDSYDSPYWKQRGRPRFYRYLKAAPSGVLSSSLRTTSLKP
jgi:cell wall-associated NlpC family hydrolase